MIEIEVFATSKAALEQIFIAYTNPEYSRKFLPQIVETRLVEGTWESAPSRAMVTELINGKRYEAEVFTDELETNRKHRSRLDHGLFRSTCSISFHPFQGGTEISTLYNFSARTFLFYLLFPVIPRSLKKVVKDRIVEIHRHLDGETFIPPALKIRILGFPAWAFSVLGWIALVIIFVVFFRVTGL